MQLFVVLIFFGAISLPRSAGDAGAPGAGKDTTAPIGGGSKAASGKARHEACNEIAEKLARFVTDADSTRWAFPDSCYGDAPKQKELKVPEAMSGVRFAIATAPDPISTHLPLLFDRIVETIQKAAQDDGYSYDDSWFPWETTTKEYFFLADQEASEELRKVYLAQPGVMVFRPELSAAGDPSPYNGGLIVFVVGEKPTGGINDDQFKNALAWVELLNGLSADKPLRILGPAFSGSLPSLRRDLEQMFSDTSPFKDYKGQLHASSGTVSSGTTYDWFNAKIKMSWQQAAAGDRIHGVVDSEARVGEPERGRSWRLSSIRNDCCRGDGIPICNHVAGADGSAGEDEQRHQTPFADFHLWVSP
jgi:hypothetical protein